MGGPDSYKNFDTSSIVTNTTADTTFTIGKSTFRKRDVILGGIALLALIGVLILAIVLAIEVHNNSDDDSSSSAQASAAKGNPRDMCRTRACLQAAYEAKSKMNDTVNPCEDFYRYACGGYAAANPRTPYLENVNELNKIYAKNLDHMVYIINSPPNRDTEHSYERKLKDFFSACTNHFDKMDLRGLPFLHHVVSKTPGWYLFGEFNVTNFDLQEMLKTVHVDFWTDAFFHLHVSNDMKNWKETVVEMDYGGFGLPDPQLYNQYFQYEQNIYSQYIQHVASLITYDRDPTSPADPQRIITFASEALEVERQLAQVLLSSGFVAAPHDEENLVTLEQVNTDMGGQIDIIDYMKSLFNEWTSKFTKDTKVAVYREEFFVNLGAVLKAYMATDSGKRKLHNYLMWQLLNRYSHELSWDYVHAKRKLLQITNGWEDASDGSLYCFLSMEAAMTEAMSAVFLTHYVQNGTKAEAVKMMDTIKRYLKDGLQSFPWMSGDDRKEARAKIDDTVFKIGFEDYMVNEDLMDREYMTASISVEDHFGNILNLNKIHQKNLNDFVGFSDMRTEWVYHVWNPAVEYNNFWHAMTATYAMFQDPLFLSKGPYFQKYGGVGSLLAEHLLHAVDEHGSQFKLDRSNLGNWWSNTTTRMYKEVKECAINATKDYKFGPFRIGDTPIPVNSTFIHQFHAPLLLSEATGIRLSLKAYREQFAKEELPSIFPGQTPEKLFFIAYAQTHCENTPDIFKLNRLFSSTVPGDARVNLAVTQIPEFAQAFKCAPTSKLNSRKKCLLFP